MKNCGTRKYTILQQKKTSSKKVYGTTLSFHFLLFYLCFLGEEEARLWKLESSGMWLRKIIQCLSFNLQMVRREYYITSFVT